MQRAHFRSDWWNVAGLLIAAVIFMGPAFWLGHIVGHSSVLNVNWAQAFAQQLAQGVLLPRWLPEMTAGAGSAAFYFYGPLPFYLAAPFYWMTGNAALAVVCAQTVLLAASGIAAYALCRFYVLPAAALMAALICMVLPYHFAADIWFRAAFAEQATFVFMPLCFLMVLHLERHAWAFIGLALAYAAQICSHLPSALLLAPVLAGFAISQAVRLQSWHVAFKAATAGLLAIGLAAFYLWPALELQSMIQPGFWHVDEAADNLLLGSKSTQDLSLFVFPIALEIGLFIVLAVGLFKMRAEARVWAVLAILVLLLISIAARPLWVISGIFNRVQFPWRALSIVEVAATVLIAMSLEARRFRIVIAGFVFAVVCGLAVATYSQLLFYTAGDAPNRMSLANDLQDFALKTDASEYLPGCFDLPPDAHKAMTHNLARARMESGAGAQDKFYYPFLAAMRDGKPVALVCDPQTGLAKAADGAPGALVFEAVALPEEKLGGWVSLASLIALAASAALLRRVRLT